MRNARSWPKSFYLIALVLGLASFDLMSTRCFAADNGTNCDKILTELQTGKSAKQIAQEMGIQESEIYRCERKATRSIPSAAPSPGAMPSPSAPSH
jgi:hypothetical protein